MSQALILLRKSILNFRRAKAAIVITFLVPVILIALFGFVFGLYGKKSDASGFPLAVVNLSDEPAAAKLIDALKAEPTLSIRTTIKNPDGTSRPLTEADVRAELKNGNAYHFALILPPDLLSDERIGAHLIFLTDPRNEMEAQMVTGLVQRTVFMNVPSLLGQSLQRNAKRYLGDDRMKDFNSRIASAVASNFGGDPAEIQKRIESGSFLSPTAAPNAPATTTATAQKSDDQAASDFLSRLVKFDTEQVAGKAVKNPMASRIVGGYAIMFLLFAVSGSAASMFEERRSGVMQRLLSAPVRPSHILWSRFMFGALLGLAQIGALFLAGWALFGLEVFAHLPALLAVAISAAAACSAFGMLIAAVSPSEEASRGLATLLVISMSAVGGAWFPIFIMPSYIQVISKCTIVYWSVEGFTDVLWAGRSFLEVLPKVGILAGIAAVVLAFSIWRFNRSKFFE